MIIGSVTLAAPYSPGVGYVQCRGLAEVLLGMDALPTRVTLYGAMTYGTARQRSTTYNIATIGGSTIGLGSVVSGADQTFRAGDLVYLQAIEATGAGTGTVTSVATAGPIQGGPITSAGTISLGTTGFQINQNAAGVGTATYGSTTTFNLATYSRWQVQLAGNPTLALSGDPGQGQFMLILQQDSTGSRTVTWWSGILWAGGTAPTLTTTPGKRDVVSFWEISSGVYLGFVAGQGF